jgi:hypothetical protein
MIGSILKDNGCVNHKEIIESGKRDFSKMGAVMNQCDAIIEQKRRLYTYYTTPLDPQIRDTIWNVIFDSAITAPSMAVLLGNILTPTEVNLFFQFSQLHKECTSPPDLTRLIGLLPISSFKKLHFLMETITDALQIQMVNLDVDSISQIHDTMMEGKFGLIPAIHEDPRYYREMYKVFYTICCNRVVTVRPTPLAFGHSYISFNPATRHYVCNKKKIKKPKETNDLVKATSVTSAVAAADGSVILDGEDEEEEEPQDSATPAASDTTYNIFATLFSKINLRNIIRPVPAETLDQLERSMDDGSDTTLDLSIQVQMDTLIKKLTYGRFQNGTVKKQNKIVRVVKKLRQPNCTLNPPVMVLDSFGKRFYHGKNDTTKRVYQHCLSCGNFTNYYDENWHSSTYECFNCWLNSLSILCQCMYCRGVAHHTLEKVAQVKKDAESLADTETTQHNEDKDFQGKANYDAILKSQNRMMILKFLLHLPQFPLTFLKLSENQQYQLLVDKFQLNPEEIRGRYAYPLAAHRDLYRDSHLSWSKACHTLPCYFTANFCQHHRPMNPNLIRRKNAGIKEELVEAEEKVATISHQQRTPTVTATNLNVNNPYRISLLEEYWTLLNKKIRGKAIRQRYNGENG